MSRSKSIITILIMSSLAWTGGCSDDDPQPADASVDGPVDGLVDAAVPDAAQPLPTHCNPLSTDECLLPWPSSFYLSKDSTTKTGYRVNYPIKAMPRNVNLDDPKKPGKSVDPARYNLLDGFSIGSQLLVYFKAGVSKKGLPAKDKLADSITDKSLIWLMEFKTGKKVPLFAEVDQNAKPDRDELGGLIIRPQVRLEYNTRYVAVLRTGLKDAKGNALKPPESFRKIRDGETITDKVLQQEASRLKDMLTFLDKKVGKRSEILLAWDFHTGSQELIQTNLTFMVEDGLKRLPAAGPAFSDLKAVDLDKATSPEVMRTIEGNMMVPSYLATSDKGSWLKLDKSGKPVYQRLQKYPFYVHIPRCAETATAPLPVFVFGHGLFGTLKGELPADYHKKLQAHLCMVTITGLWIGLTEGDVPDILKQVITENFSNLPRITDQLQQAQVIMHTLVKLLKGDFLKDKSMQVNGKPVTDGKEFYYLGISNGGIQGVAFSALSKDITHFVFSVSAGVWSMMIQRSSNFALMAMALANRYPRAIDRAALVSMSQHLWDYTDPITWGRHVVQSPFTGYPKKKIILQESRYDDQVPNLATRIVARTLGLTAMTPAVESVYGLTEKAGPLESAFVQWDTKPKVKPHEGNIPAPKPEPSESAHLTVRQKETWRKQLKAFYKSDGQVINPCSGACDPD